MLYNAPESNPIYTKMDDTSKKKIYERKSLRLTIE